MFRWMEPAATTHLDRNGHRGLVTYTIYYDHDDDEEKDGAFTLIRG